MKHDYIRNFNVGELQYEFRVTKDYEIMFQSLSNGLDEWGYPIGGFTRIPSNPKTALRVFMKMKALVKEYIYQHRPPYVYFTVGMDYSRYSAYKTIAKRMGKEFEKIGYQYVEDTGSRWMFMVVKMES